MGSGGGPKRAFITEPSEQRVTDRQWRIERAASAYGKPLKLQSPSDTGIVRWFQEPSRRPEFSVSGSGRPASASASASTPIRPDEFALRPKSNGDSVVGTAATASSSKS